MLLREIRDGELDWSRRAGRFFSRTRRSRLRETRSSPAKSAAYEYSHIIDPKTGLGLSSAIAVTVVARRGLDADPIATAVSVMGEKRGRAVFETEGEKAYSGPLNNVGAAASSSNWPPPQVY